MRIKVNPVYQVENNARVVMERINNTVNGAPRWRATVIDNYGAYTFNVIGYNGEADEAKEAYRMYLRAREEA